MHVGVNRGRTILIVDDDPGIILMARSALEASGHTVIGACTGAEAIHIFARRHREIAVGLLDYMLPDMLGDELLQRLSEIDGTVNFVAASGCNHDEIDESFIAGTIGFMRKPFKLKDLTAQIDSCLAIVR